MSSTDLQSLRVGYLYGKKQVQALDTELVDLAKPEGREVDVWYTSSDYKHRKCGWHRFQILP